MHQLTSSIDCNPRGCKYTWPCMCTSGMYKHVHTMILCRSIHLVWSKVYWYYLKGIMNEICYDSWPAVCQYVTTRNVAIQINLWFWGLSMYIISFPTRCTWILLLDAKQSIKCFAMNLVITIYMHQLAMGHNLRSKDISTMISPPGE